MEDTCSLAQQPDRSKIDMKNNAAVRHWCKHLGIPPTQLQKVVEKVGNSAKAIEKQLGY